jgi:hypothetical protein
MKHVLAIALPCALAAPPLEAGWHVFQFSGLGGSPMTEVLETSLVVTGAGRQDVCLAVAFNPVLFILPRRAELWCPTPNGWWKVNSFATEPVVPWVSATRKAGSAQAQWAVAEEDNGRLWYGTAGEEPELVAPPVYGASVVLSHFSDGRPFITYRGMPPDHRVFYATRDAEWTAVRLTNNFTSPTERSVASVVRGDAVHIAYWDDTYRALRYATRPPGGAWTFETVYATTGPPLMPAVAHDGERAHIAAAHESGQVLVFSRGAQGWTQAQVGGPPIPASLRNVALQADRRLRLHLAYVAHDGPSERIVYASRRLGGQWSEPEVVDPLVEPASRRFSVSLALQEDFARTVPHIGYILELEQLTFAYGAYRNVN